MTLLSEGIWPCKVISGKSGEDDKGAPNVQINVQITEGPSAGRLCTYEDTINAKSSLYIGRSCKAVGWKGGPMKSLAADIAAWIAATGGMSTVEIKHLEIKNGKRAGQIWDKPNSIGRGPKPLREMSQSTAADADDAMRMAMEVDSPSDGGTYEDGPPRDDVPPPSDDNIPF